MGSLAAKEEGNMKREEGGGAAKGRMEKVRRQ